MEGREHPKDLNLLSNSRSETFSGAAVTAQTQERQDTNNSRKHGYYP